MVDYKAIVLDMDGTFCDLYGIENWLAKLRAEDVSPYVEAAPMYNMRELKKRLFALRKKGWRIVILSALAGGNVSEAYLEAIKRAKRAWLDRYNFPADEVIFTSFTENKREAYSGYGVLIDDNEQNREAWRRGNNGGAYDPMTDDLLNVLEYITDFHI